MPDKKLFGPLDGGSAGFVRMEADEFETIRLIDALGMTQEDCARQMNVARTTVQAIYASARKKLAICLTDGRALCVCCSDSVVFDDENEGCGCMRCRKGNCGKENYNENSSNL